MIKINVVSYNSVAPAPPLSAVFGREPKTLGRSEENHLILPDFRNYVSRIQAAVKSDGVQHKITNLSRANPILLNGHEINPECECDLQTGDEIQIGLYLLRAEAQPNLMKDSPDMSSQREHAAINPNQFTDIPEALPSVSENRKAAATQPNLELVAGTGSTASTPLQGLAAEEKPSAAADPARHADNHALILAFMKGAGLPAGALAPGLTPEMMETVGRLLATAVQGTIDLNASRALVKREAHADVTKVVVRNNNPLKFFTDSQTVLIQMLRKKMPGFMGANEAMRDAYQDLHAHQFGVVSGMRATMHEMVQRLNPEVIEKRQKPAGFLEWLMPAARKARLWDAYVACFQDIVDEASADEFQVLFGKSFLQAYERKVEKMKKEGRHN